MQSIQDLNWSVSNITFPFRFLFFPSPTIFLPRISKAVKSSCIIIVVERAHLYPQSPYWPLLASPETSYGFWSFASMSTHFCPWTMISVLGSCTGHNYSSHSDISTPADLAPPWLSACLPR